MTNLKELTNFVKSNIENEYTIVWFIECNKELGSERSGIIIHEDVDGEQFTTISYHSLGNKGLESYGTIASQKHDLYNGDGWDVEQEDVITGFYIESVVHADYNEYQQFINNNWGDDIVMSISRAKEIEL